MEYASPALPEVIQRLEDRIEASGLSIAEVCRRARVSQSTVYRWRHKHQFPTYRILAKFDEVLPPEPARKRAA